MLGKGGKAAQVTGLAFVVAHAPEVEAGTFVLLVTVGAAPGRAGGVSGPARTSQAMEDAMG